ncbi:MAG TPA: methanogenesis marker 3 protein [Methanomassiliicoccales archaeon]|nr:methanogenesis marker 3 protein [Methanomassiliicoccales archaeon]
MHVIVNGVEKELSEGATLSEALAGERYVPGCAVSIAKSAETVRRETDDFELVTPSGPIGLRLNGSPFAEMFKRIVKDVEGRGIRWQTSKVLAVGSFATDIQIDRSPFDYKRYDCFFAAGGFDAKTTYMMIAKSAHQGVYGAAGGVLGKITTGRHILNLLVEGEKIIAIRPVVEERLVREAVTTTDLDTRLSEGMAVESFVEIVLDKRSPVSVEHFLVAAEKGMLPITNRTATFAACSSSMDVSLVAEATGVRERGLVTVRNSGVGQGRIYFYLERRQISALHNTVGTVSRGLELVKLAPAGARLTVLTLPERMMTIGMTQKQAQTAIESRGSRQSRTGDIADDAIVVEQEPELTMDALDEPQIETLGVRPEKVNDLLLMGGKAPATYRYFRKMTGLDHKPIGTMKVHFTFPEMPLITFEGDAQQGGVLVPENQFGAESKRGDLAITNMSRPSRGLIGIRLDPSEEFGPTGEERFGTNLLGSMATSLDELMKNIQEGDIVYVREAAQKPAPVRKPRKSQVARKTATKKVAAKTPVKKSREAKRAKKQ